jgi:hypothetical protein
MPRRLIACKLSDSFFVASEIVGSELYYSHFFSDDRIHLLLQRGDLCSAWLPLSVRSTN